MNERLEQLLGEFFGNYPADPDSIFLLERFFETFGKKLPNDLREILEATDGAEGMINENFLRLWGASDIIESNKSYQADLYAPGLLLFGTNGGGEAYAFDTRPVNSMPVVEVPFIGMDLKYANFQASTLTDFLEKLNNDNV